MRTFLIANPKGGCGKSTLSVHLASWFSSIDEMVCLGDLDRQQSSRRWLASRPPSLPAIRHWAMTEGEMSAPPTECSLAILDTPAGLHGKPLKKLLAEVDRVVVPISPSSFDMQASRDFFEELAEIKAVRKDKVGIAIVGMRVDRRTHSTRQLIEFLDDFELPLLTCIRSAQRYVQALDSGLTLFDTPTRDPVLFDEWKPLLDWLISRRSGTLSPWAQQPE
jgi:chromosome partitioning protein